MAKKKAKSRNNRKRNNGPAKPPETSAEPLDQSEIATWLDTFNRLAGEVVEEDEGISHLAKLGIPKQQIDAWMHD